MQHEETPARRPLPLAILSDLQFWVPFVVLLLGIAVLVFCARS